MLVFNPFKSYLYERLDMWMLDEDPPDAQLDLYYHQFINYLHVFFFFGPFHFFLLLYEDASYFIYGYSVGEC